MKKVIWKSNISIRLDLGSIVVSAVDDSCYLLRRKRGTEIPTMKAKNIIQWKKTDNKKKK